jgi:hypothetical protein
VASFRLNEIGAEARDATSWVLGIKEERTRLAPRAASSFNIVFALASTSLDIALVVIANRSALVALAFFAVRESVIPGKTSVAAFAGDERKTSALAVVVIAAFRCSNSSFRIAVAELASLKIIID